MKPRLRSSLQGWDFRDIATSRDPLYLRVTTPPDSGQTWIDLVNSTRAVTLFGRGFGDLIKPVPSASVTAMLKTWITIPTGEGFLTASVADLMDMTENEGDKTTFPLTLSRGIVWHSPSEHIFAPPLADGNMRPAAEWTPIQELLPAEPSILKSLLMRKGTSKRVDIDSSQHGAVIFGRCRSSKPTRPNLRGDLVHVGSSGEDYELAGEHLEMQLQEMQPSDTSSGETATNGDGSMTNTYYSSISDPLTTISTPTTSTSTSTSTQITTPISPSSRPSMTAFLRSSMSRSGPGSQHDSIGAADAPDEQQGFSPDPAVSRKRPAATALGDDDEDDIESHGGIAKRLRDMNANLRDSFREGLQRPSWGKRGDD